MSFIAQIRITVNSQIVSCIPVIFDIHLNLFRLRYEPGWGVPWSSSGHDQLSLQEPPHHPRVQEENRILAIYDYPGYECCRVRTDL